MKIGHYEVVRLLGKGGMSEVYEVEDPRLGSRHALKRFAYPREDAEVRARFETEGRLLAKLAHPRIVKVTDLGVDEASGQPYFVMDAVLDEKGDVRSLADIPEGAADEETIGRWYDDVREGLAYIHSRGIIHRDLKLQNILIGVDGHAVITDFGISKITDPAEAESIAVDPVQTIIRMKNGQKPVMGSLGYMAPELEMGVPASEKSDWFALGVIVYKLLTGVWCDARTDVAGTLATYDPVWSRIIPKLLHSNPQGRECLSYSEEKRKDGELHEFELEEKWLREKSRGHLARHIARYVGALTVLLAGVTMWCYCESRAWQRKLETEEARRSMAMFDGLFGTPSEASADEQTDDDGNVLYYSRQDYALARIDALVMVHETLDDLATGEITAEKALAEFEDIYRGFGGDDSEESPCDSYMIGNESYMPHGQRDPLRQLFQLAIEKLRKHIGR